MKDEEQRHLIVDLKMDEGMGAVYKQICDLTDNTELVYPISLASDNSMIPIYRPSDMTYIIIGMNLMEEFQDRLKGWIIGKGDMTTTLERLSGPPEWIIEAVKEVCPEIEAVLGRVRAQVPFIKREISEYQGAILYALARQYDRAGAAILEIGTAWGYSAACMASAASRAAVTTLNPKETEFPQAVAHLSHWPNVTVVQKKSWDYYEQVDDTFDMIFVDGDHGQVRRDLVWWERVRPGGLFIFHDYSPDESWRPCQEVYEAVNDFGRELGRPMDVYVSDNRGVGLAGFYKK